ncbi:MAG: hypothetical protein CVU57_31280, partial [Deltaproteobacteria bacterium HGW-Deltaproteobacteria-15]|jgi:peptidoglycan/xylan/chitin deacetylase (PgdA/CDA1 family)
MTSRRDEKRLLARGAFCFSFDFELSWGNFDRYDRALLEKKSLLAREIVLPRLLDMLRRYRVSATWAVVGHLMLDSCDRIHGNPTPHHAWLPDWYCHDPGSSERENPQWYARSFVKQLMAMEPAQDIGLHGFSHCIWGEPGCSRDVAEREMKNALEAAGGLGLTPRSFVFPRNSINHLDVLRSAGIRVFREQQESWYGTFPKKVRRVCHFASQWIGLPPSSVLPRSENGMTCLPSSALYSSMDGIRKRIPISTRVNRAIKGMERAVGERAVFHLTTHPVYLAYEDRRTDELLDGLDRIFAHARDLRGRGVMDVLNMAQIAERMSQ